MKNKILTGLLLVLIGGWGSLSAQSAGSNYSRQVPTLMEWCSLPPLTFPNVPDSSSTN